MNYIQVNSGGLCNEKLFDYIKDKIKATWIILFILKHFLFLFKLNNVNKDLANKYHLYIYLISI